MAKFSCPTADGAATPADTLRNAAAYLVEHGWIRGTAFANDCAATPAVCAYGAIRMAVGGSPDTHVTQVQDGAIGGAMHALARHLHNDGDLDEGDRVAVYPIVTGWNDDPATTAELVIAAMHAAADVWDRLHQADTVPGDLRRRAA